jgi:hypothetical protein
MLSAAKSAFRETATRSKSALGALGFALLVAAIGLLVLHRIDVGGLVVYVLATVVLFSAASVISLVRATVKLQRERDLCRRDFDVVQRRIGVENHIRSIVAAIESDFAAPDAEEAITPARVGWHVNTALDAVRGDPYVNAARVRELEEFQATTNRADARGRYEELHHLLRNNVYGGVYPRP